MTRLKTKSAVQWFLALMLVVALASGTTSALAAERGGHGRHGGGDDFMGPLGPLSELNLSKAQKQDIALILKDHRQDARECMTNLMAARKNLFTAVRGPEYNEEAVRQAAREVSRWEEEMAVQRARVISEVQKALTPEQKAKIAARRANFGKKIEQRVQKRMDRLDRWIDANAARP